MSNRNYSSKKSLTKAVVPITTRSGLFTGLSFKITKQSDIQKTNYLSSVPTISFSFDYTKAIIDYSQSTNENDKSLISSLFFEMKPGTNFTISQATHLIEDSESQADLSGTYSFVRLVEHAIIAQPVSVTSINQRITVYQSKHMKSIPQIGLATSVKNPLVNYTITNSLLSDKNISFIKFGIYPGDILKITGTNSNNNRYRILSVQKNADGTETLIVENTVTDEVCFGNPVLVELIQSGPFDLADKNTSLDTGSCKFTTPAGIATCYQDQTRNQCDIRVSIYPNVTPIWIKNGTCPDGSNRTIQVKGKRTSPSTSFVTSIVSTVTRPSLGTGTSQTETASAD